MLFVGPLHAKSIPNELLYTVELCYIFDIYSYIHVNCDSLIYSEEVYMHIHYLLCTWNVQMGHDGTNGIYSYICLKTVQCFPFIAFLPIFYYSLRRYFCQLSCLIPFLLLGWIQNLFDFSGGNGLNIYVAKWLHKWHHSRRTGCAISRAKLRGSLSGGNCLGSHVYAIGNILAWCSHKSSFPVSKALSRSWYHPRTVHPPLPHSRRP